MLGIPLQVIPERQCQPIEFKLRMATVLPFMHSV